MDSNVLLFNSPPQRNVWLPTILETLALYCQTSVNFGSSVLPVPGIGLLYPLIPTEGSKSGVAMKLPPKLDAKPKALIAEFERLGSTVSVWLPTILETVALYCQTSVNFGSSVLPVPGIGLLYPLIPTEGSKSGYSNPI